MTGWGDALTPRARADVQALADAAIAAGRAALADAEVIAPIPFLLATSGQIVPLSIDRLVAPGTGLPEQAEAALGALAKAAPAARAVALVTTTRSGGRPSLEIWVEHAEGAALSLLQPYRRSLLGGLVEFQPLAAYPGVRRIWG